MNVFAALVWREFTERRLLLLASAFLGLVPLIVPFLPGSPQIKPQDLRLATTVVVTLLFGGTVLVVLGSTIVGRDLSEGRLGFFFSRPISAWSLWTSRIVAAVLLLLASLALLTLPTALLDSGVLTGDRIGESSQYAWPLLGFKEVFALPGVMRSLPDMPSRPVRLGILLVALVTLLALIHAASTIVRGRSAWVLVDLTGLGATLMIGWWARNLLIGEEAITALVWAEWFLLPWILAAALAAGAVQLARGRTDLKLGHRYLSATLWPALLLGALIFYGFAQFVVASSIDDLENAIHLRASPDEAWLVVGGRVQHRGRAEAAFLLDTATERSWRLGSLGAVHAWFDFSDDGRTAAWVRCRSFARLDCSVWAKDLADAASSPRRTPVPFDSRPNELVLNADGSRLAMVGWRRMAIYDLASGSLLAAVDVNHPNDTAFVTSDRIRFMELDDGDDPPGMRLVQFDIPSRQLSEIGNLPRSFRTLLSLRDERVIFTQTQPLGFGLYDTASAQPVGELHLHQRLPSQVHFLADGRCVLVFRNGFEVSLSVLSAAGELEYSVNGPKTLGTRFGGEIAPGRVLVGFNEVLGDPEPMSVGGIEGATERRWATYVFDVETRQLEAIGVGVRPVGSRRNMSKDHLFMAPGSTILRWNLESADHKVLLGPFEGAEQARDFELKPLS
ncbi:MAG: hypothetical protein AAF560_16730 [Acidobacteriota bacterium]